MHTTTELHFTGTTVEVQALGHEETTETPGVTLYLSQNLWTGKNDSDLHLFTTRIYVTAAQALAIAASLTDAAREALGDAGEVEEEMNRACSSHRTMNSAPRRLISTLVNEELDQADRDEVRAEFLRRAEAICPSVGLHEASEIITTCADHADVDFTLIYEEMEEEYANR